MINYWLLGITKSCIQAFNNITFCFLQSLTSSPQLVLFFSFTVLHNCFHPSSSQPSSSLFALWFLFSSFFNCFFVSYFSRRHNYYNQRTRTILLISDSLEHSYSLDLITCPIFPPFYIIFFSRFLLAFGFCSYGGVCFKTSSYNLILDSLGVSSSNCSQFSRHATIFSYSEMYFTGIFCYLSID